MPKPRRERIAELLKAGVLNQAEIARETGVSRQWVGTVARELGIRDIPTEFDDLLLQSHAEVNRASRNLAAFKSKRATLVRQAIKGGVNPYRISRILGIPRSTVVDIAKK